MTVGIIIRNRVSPRNPVSFIFSSGEGGIRTHGGPKTTTVFETAPFNHSGTSPVLRPKLYQILFVLLDQHGLHRVGHLDLFFREGCIDPDHRRVFGRQNTIFLGVDPEVDSEIDG